MNDEFQDPNTGKFKKGNPGRKPGLLMDPEYKTIRALTQSEVAKIGTAILKCTIEDLKGILRNPESQVLHSWIAAIALRSIERGDVAALSLLLDRISGKISNAHPYDKIEEKPKLDLMLVQIRNIMETNPNAFKDIKTVGGNK